MSDPIMIGGKANAPGPKVLNKLKKTAKESIPINKLIKSKEDINNEHLPKGIKEIAAAIDFRSSDNGLK